MIRQRLGIGDDPNGHESSTARRRRHALKSALGSVVAIVLAGGLFIDASRTRERLGPTVYSLVFPWMSLCAFMCVLSAWNWWLPHEQVRERRVRRAILLMWVVLMLGSVAGMILV